MTNFAFWTRVTVSQQSRVHDRIRVGYFGARLRPNYGSEHAKESQAELAVVKTQQKTT